MRWFRPFGFVFCTGLDSWLDDYPSRWGFLRAHLLVGRRAFPFRFRHAVWRFSLLGSDVSAVGVDCESDE
jgi:hypothetical protein